MLQAVYKAADNIWSFKGDKARCPTLAEFYSTKEKLPLEKHMMADTHDPCQSMLYLMREELGY